jgi:hypothetical protein
MEGKFIRITLFISLFLQENSRFKERFQEVFRLYACFVKRADYALLAGDMIYPNVQQERSNFLSAGYEFILNIAKEKVIPILRCFYGIYQFLYSCTVWSVNNRYADKPTESSRRWAAVVNMYYRR